MIIDMDNSKLMCVCSCTTNRGAVPTAGPPARRYVQV